MPRLALFAPCERVILGQDNSTTLISVLGTAELNIRVDPGADERTSVAFSWTVLAIWEREELDRPEQQFEQKVEWVAPDKRTVLFTQSLAFQIKARYHRNNYQVFGLPIMDSGDYELRISVRSGENSAYKLAGSFKWPIRRVAFSADASAEPSVSPAGDVSPQ